MLPTFASANANAKFLAIHYETDAAYAHILALALRVALFRCEQLTRYTCTSRWSDLDLISQTNQKGIVFGLRMGLDGCNVLASFDSDQIQNTANAATETAQL